MPVPTYRFRSVRLGTVLVLGLLLAACGSSSSNEPPSVAIANSTAAPTYSTTQESVRLGGTVSRAGFVRVRNFATGFTADAFVIYVDGQGSWFADILELVPGDNPITVTADADGTGARTAQAQITVVRPLQPADLIFNGPDQGGSSTFWTDTSSIDQSHKIALFEDGTGRATTGSALSETAGAVTAFTWTKTAPDAIQIVGCAACSFESISRISGSFDEAGFYGQIETVGGIVEGGLHFFSLEPGAL